MNLLAIDTSTNICCVSVYCNNEKIITTTEKVISSHTQLLASFVYNIINKNNFSIKELDHIILSIGPGSYSGLRASSSFAKGLAYAINKNIITVNTILNPLIEIICTADFNSDDVVNIQDVILLVELALN